MNSISVMEDKTLKLQNVLSYRVSLTEENTTRLDMEVDKMNTYIETHGGRQIGPLIHHSYIEQSNSGEVDIKMEFMLQSDRYLDCGESPYEMEETRRVPSCLYARYVGPEEKLKFAYDKLGVYAFENDIDILGGSYTVFVDRNEEEEKIVADIFMPMKVD